MIKVLVVDDTPVMRLLLSRILGKDHEIEIVGLAHNGQEAVDLVKALRPDVVTMDLFMPVLDGYQATSRIMEQCPTPVVIVSAAYHPEEVEMTFRALKAGAVAILEKPFSSFDERHEVSARELISTVKLMSQVKLVTRRPERAHPPKHRPAPPAGRCHTEPAPEPRPAKPREGLGDIRAVALAASTGGPPVLQSILSALPGNFPLPVFLVQHITTNFVQGLADWLNVTSALPVRLAEHNEIVEPGVCYLAPGGFHLQVRPGQRIALSPCSAERGAICPSASLLLESMLRSYGHNSLNVLLTGMGRDGVEELLRLRRAGALTVAQDKASCVVFGMPGEAVKTGAAELVLTPTEIVELLRKVASEVGRAGARQQNNPQSVRSE
ncbi:chemotaxis-specific protein-glutamate methyltransferase CheB [Fundidesulfovibrio butyratiphilus]